MPTESPEPTETPEPTPSPEPTSTPTPAPTGKLYERVPGIEMPGEKVNGHEYIGTLSIPSLGLKVPVQRNWSYENLSVSPCRYSGSAYAGNLAIIAHTYHFGKLSSLALDATVTFTDMENNVFRYVVREKNTISPNDANEIAHSGYDLTLVTCTLSGTKRVAVYCERVGRHFKDLPQDSIPYIPTQVEVQIITQQPKIPLEEIEDVKSRLREYTDRVNKGESFSMLARLYSDDRGTAINGGEMPFTGRGYLDPAFANVAFNLQDPNKVSKIVESEYGFHIIQLMEKRGDRIKVRHILLKPHVPEEALMAGTARLDSIADDIRNGKFTFEEAASVLSQDKDTRNNHGLLPNPQTNTSKFEMQELPPEIAKVVDKMKVGEISEAFTMIPQKTGKEECVIVKLKSRINGHKATISEDYQNLKEIVLEKRRDEMLDKWIREKQKHTYVRINENWKNCTFKYPGWIKD